jgi:hypothetical protein
MLLKSKMTTLLSTLFLIALFCLQHTTTIAQSYTDNRQLSCATGNQIARDVDVNTNGWVFTAGSGQNTSPTTYDGSLIVTDGALNTKWEITFVGAGNDELNGVDVISSGTYSAEVYVTGYFTGSMTMTRYDSPLFHNVPVFLATITAPGGSNDPTYFVSKFDLDGNHIWTRIAGQVGQNNTDIGNDVSVVQVGTTRYVYTTGFWRGTTTFTGHTGSAALSANASFNDAFVACYIDNGNTTALQWVNTIAVPNKHDYGWALQANSVGDVYVTGSVSGGVTVTGTGGTSLVLGNIGGDDAYLLKYGANGAILRSIVFGGNAVSGGAASDCGRGIALGANGRIVVSGYYKGNSGVLGNAATQDAFLLGFTETGVTFFNYAWKDFFRGTGNDLFYRIATSQDQFTCYAAGSYTGDMNPTYNGAPGPTQTASNPGPPNADSFFATVNASNGAAVGTVMAQWDDINADALTGAAVLENSTAYFCGIYSGDFYYDPPTASGFSLNNCFPGSYESVVLEWDTPFKRAQVDEPITQTLDLGSGSIYPNPTTGKFTLDLKGVGAATVQVHDMYGKSILAAMESVDPSMVLDLSNHPSGIYFVTVQSAQGSKTLRVVRQ